MCGRGLNGAGLTTWIVDLRPYGKRKYFSSKDAALGEAQIQRIRLRKEGLEGFEFTLDQRTDALAALTVLANYQGAFTFQVAYLAWFFAAGTSTTSAMQQIARQAANLYIDNAFATHPGFNI